METSPEICQPGENELSKDEKFTKNQEDRETDSATKEKTILLQLFPEEIWLIIFDKLNTFSPTYESIANSNLFFRQLLLSKRTTYLFPTICSLVLENGFKIKSNAAHCCVGHSGCMDRSTLIRNWVKNSRLVCTTWCAGIDKFYQNHPKHFRMTLMDPRESEVYRGVDYEYDQNCPFIPSNIFIEKAKLSNALKISNILSHFQSTHRTTLRSPIESRFVSIVIDDDDFYFESFSNRLLEFLKAYGNRVWHVNLRIVNQLSNFSQSAIKMSYTLLHQYLSLLPNLRSFKLLSCYALRQKIYLSKTEQLMVMPTFSHLQHFATLNIPTYLVDKILKQNTHIISFENIRRASYYDCDIPLHTLPHLTTLSIDIRSDWEFKSIGNSQLGEQLESLHIRFPNYVKWSKAFELLETRFACNVKKLVLALPRASNLENEREILEESIVFRLVLPKLSRLKLVIANFCSIDFLLSLSRTLKILCIQKLSSYYSNIAEIDVLAKEMEAKEKIQLLRCDETFEISNIWQLFPSLQEVYLQKKNKQLEFLRPPV